MQRIFNDLFICIIECYRNSTNNCIQSIVFSMNENSNQTYHQPSNWWMHTSYTFIHHHLLFIESYLSKMESLNCCYSQRNAFHRKNKNRRKSHNILFWRIIQFIHQKVNCFDAHNKACMSVRQNAKKFVWTDCQCKHMYIMLFELNYWPWKGVCISMPSILTLKTSLNLWLHIAYCILW